jgi:epoxyqueuosine reductase
MSTISPWIAERAKAIGFDLCGVVRPEKFPELGHIDDWLAKGFAGEMKYLADPRRRDPAAAMQGIRSVIVCALNYNADLPSSTEAIAQPADENPRGWISRYAWGRDYHDVLREKLEALVKDLHDQIAEPFDTRVYADTGPIQERVFAKYAGLGWLGKNTLLLNQNLGSFFFLGVILTSLDLQPTLSNTELPPPDLCGTCRRCIDACPTDALVEPYVMDARRCISYLTIELRGSIPEALREPTGLHVFGCDICQDVCPWNRKAPSTLAADFQPRSFSARQSKTQPKDSLPSLEPDAAEESLFLPRLEWLASMTEEEFRQIFKGSPIKRTKWRGLVRNACIALGNSEMEPGSSQSQRSSAILKHLASSAEPAISESAQWALARIKENSGAL